MESENLEIKQVVKILYKEINEWLRWGRGKDYLPPSFRCPLGFLYLPPRGDLEARLYKPVPINFLEALEFERIVVGLPVKHRQAFVMYHLDRAHINGRIVEKKRTGYEIARLLGVHRSRYYVLLTQAHNMVFRDWRQQQEKKFEKKV